MKDYGSRDDGADHDLLVMGYKRIQFNLTFTLLLMKMIPVYGGK